MAAIMATDRMQTTMAAALMLTQAVATSGDSGSSMAMAAGS